MQNTVRRIIYVLKPHDHSVYAWCPECHGWGINMPNDSQCGNCGGMQCVEYYPTGTPSNNRARWTPRLLAWLKICVGLGLRQ